nr:unnamed protein product [Digitaria exilis]
MAVAAGRELHAAREADAGAQARTGRLGGGEAGASRGAWCSGNIVPLTRGSIMQGIGGVLIDQVHGRDKVRLRDGSNCSLRRWSHC